MTQRRRMLVTGSLAIAACAAAAAACGTPAGTPQPGSGQAGVTTPSAGAVPHARISQTYCRQAPSSLVGPALGLRAGALEPTVEGPVQVCAYGGPAGIIVRYQVGESAAQFAADRSSLSSLHEVVTTVGGLGDGAFYARSAPGRQLSGTLAARKGFVAVFITSPAALSAEKSLMIRLLAGL